MSSMSQTSVLTTSLHLQAVEDNHVAIGRAESTSNHTNDTIQNQDDEEFLTSNGQPTGQEPNLNPQWWPEYEHRRVPLYQRAVTHPHWYVIGGDTAAIRWFMWTMFSGCQIIQHAYSIPRFFGFHKYRKMQYKIANEW
ncbi:hypothetical protein D6D00_10166 [Aureobasidium pullulans]|nr:hypothetical protein D6D00_10166 [Aureobasidium pullulans]